MVDGNGTISGKANGTTINAGTDVQCVGGSKLVFTAVPNAGYMVQAWSIDGEVQANLSNTLTIDALTKNTVVTVRYEALALYNIPGSGDSYEITNVQRTPADYGSGTGTEGADQIRGRGTVTFTVAPKDLGDKQGYMSTLIINGYDCIKESGSYDGGTITSGKNANGTYTITISNVTKDITAVIEANKVVVNNNPTDYQMSESAAEALKTTLKVTEDGNLAAAIKAALNVKTENAEETTHYDVTLQKWDTTTGAWTPVTSVDEFPDGGLDVVLPYPAGAIRDDSYTIAHMYTTEVGGHTIGDIETFTQNGVKKYEAKSNGLHIHVDGLSPFAIGWTKKAVVPTPTPMPGGGGGGGGGGAAAHIIDAAAASGGSISPSGAVSVKDGESQTFLIEADTGYLLTDVLVDGKSVGAASSYTFEAVSASHTISASFARYFSAAETGVADRLDTETHMAYLGGYTDGSFGPENNMSRAEVAQMFYRLLLEQNVESTGTYSDVPVNAWYAQAVNTLSSAGVIQGVGGNRFAPDREITRAEFLTIAMRFAKAIPGGEKAFSDVAPSDWYYAQISGAAQYGWIGGYADGSFKPNAAITRAEVTTIVNRMLNRSADTSHMDAHEKQLRLFPDVKNTFWAYYTILEATNSHHYTLGNGREAWTGLY